MQQLDAPQPRRASERDATLIARHHPPAAAGDQHLPGEARSRIIVEVDARIGQAGTRNRCCGIEQGGPVGLQQLVRVMPVPAQQIAVQIADRHRQREWQRMHLGPDPTDCSMGGKDRAARLANPPAQRLGESALDIEADMIEADVADIWLVLDQREPEIALHQRGIACRWHQLDRRAGMRPLEGGGDLAIHGGQRGRRESDAQPIGRAAACAAPVRGEHGGGQRGRGGAVHDGPAREPAHRARAPAKLSMKRFCARRKAMTSGAVVISAAAINGP